MKVCSSCGKRKPAHDYQVRRLSRDGLTAACRDCLNARDAARAFKANRVAMRRRVATERRADPTKRALDADSRIHGLRDTRMPECSCPWCHHKLDSAMAADPNEPDATPSPGDATVCISCAQILVVTDDLTLRASMPGEIEITPELRRVQELVRRLDRRTME